MEENFDFTLADVEYELWALEEYRDALERQLQFLRDQDEVRTQAQLQKSHETDPEWIRAAWEIHDHRVNRILPRMLRGSFLIALWAVFEAGVLEIAKMLCPKGHKPLKAQPAETFVDRVATYFSADLKLPIVITQTTRDQLSAFLLARHAYGHANGRLEAVKANQLPELEKVLSKGLGVTEEGGFLFVSEPFLRTSHEAVVTVIRPLIAHYYSIANQR